MKRHRLTETQIVAVLHEARGGTSMREVCRRHGITETTFLRWRAKRGGMAQSEVKRLKQLEDENRRPRKLVADLSLDVGMLKDVAGRSW